MSISRPYELKSPKRIQIHLTDQCNLNCKFCDKGFRKGKSNDISKGKWEKVIKGIKSLGPERVIVSGGGEPLLRPETFNMVVDELEDKDIYTSLITNGTHLDRDMIEKLIEKDWNHINFSLHSPFAEVSDFLRGKKGSFIKTVENIRKLKKLKDEKDSKEPTMAITSVINKYNYSQIGELSEFVQRLDVKTLVLKHLHGDYGRLEPPEGSLEGVQREIEESSGDIKIEPDFQQQGTSEDDRETNNNEMVCPSPFFEMTVLADGTVTPCCFIFDSGEYTETVHDKELEEIWHGEKFELLRQSSYTGEEMPPCKDCFASQKEMEDLRPEFEKQYKQSLEETLGNNKC